VCGVVVKGYMYGILLYTYIKCVSVCGGVGLGGYMYSACMYACVCVFLYVGLSLEAIYIHSVCVCVCDFVCWGVVEAIYIICTYVFVCL